MSSQDKKAKEGQNKKKTKAEPKAAPVAAPKENKKSDNNNIPPAKETGPALEDLIIDHIKQKGEIADSEIWASQIQKPHDDKLIGSIKKLEALSIVTTSVTAKNNVELSKDGKVVVGAGELPEVLVYQAVGSDGLSKPDLEKKIGKDILLLGFGSSMKKGYIALDKNSGLIQQKTAPTASDTLTLLKKVISKEKLTEDQVNNLKKLKYIALKEYKVFKVVKGEDFRENWNVKPIVDLTQNLLVENKWKEHMFKPHNLNSLGVPATTGHLHPLMKVRTEIREVFLEMGFEEMPTNNFVESSFWNFDALFTPQQHPVRDIQDTFFLSDPAETIALPEDYVQRVKTVHEEGGYGSFGWQYDWDLKETKSQILRTHTTAISTRMLYKLAQEGFKPRKYFSIDRVFRNETLDATHLAEFHQVEGLVADYDLSLGHLMGIISEFFKRWGITNIKFKPAFNPYTEPSMEIFSYHEGLGKWVEIGNSGVFRPEMLEPMGLPKDVKVIAWGLSLERPTMIKYKVKNIRDLFGHKISLDFTASNPIVRLDK